LSRSFSVFFSWFFLLLSSWIEVSLVLKKKTKERTKKLMTCAMHAPTSGRSIRPLTTRGLLQWPNIAFHDDVWSGTPRACQCMGACWRWTDGVAQMNFFLFLSISSLFSLEKHKFHFICFFFIQFGSHSFNYYLLCY
jgi:hypothetical protein